MVSLSGRGDYDARYHDQGHGPIKVLGLEAGVNITVGLPVRSIPAPLSILRAKASRALLQCRLRTQINMRAIGQFSIGSTVVNSEMDEYVLSLLGTNGFSMGARTCQNSFALESISRTFPDTRQKHGALAGLARRFS